MSLLPLLILGVAQAADTSPPAWPEGAWLQVGKSQVLYDQPATSEAELLRREREIHLDLIWPEAQDDAGVVEYRVFYDQQELTRLPGGTLRWSSRVQDGTENWAVVPVDAAGNHGPRLEGRVDHVVSHDPSDSSQVLLIGILGSSGSEASVTDVFASNPEFDAALHAALDAALADGSIAVASEGGLQEAAQDDAPPNLSIRIGHRGSTQAFFERTLRYLEDGAPTWTTDDGDRKLSVQLAFHDSQGHRAWTVEVHTQPIGDGSRLSRQALTDPMSERSLGSCAVDTDYTTTGGLWVEVGTDPKGGQPQSVCERAAVPR